jgi:hypothetical protein
MPTILCVRAGSLIYAFQVKKGRHVGFCFAFPLWNFFQVISPDLSVSAGKKKKRERNATTIQQQ